MVHGWIATLADEAEHQLSVMTQDASVGVHPDVSVFVDDVYDAFYRARRLGMDIVHPLADEAGGMTRFFYQASDGRVVNVEIHTK